MSKHFFQKYLALFLLFTFGFTNIPAVNAETDAALYQTGSALLNNPPKTPPLTLEDCYKLALVQSEIVAIQKEAIARATAQMFIATSEALPEIDFTATREFQEVPKGGGNIVTTSFIDKDKHERRFTISQPLFQGFKAMGAIVGAGSYKKEQQETWIRAKELLYRDVAFAFYNVLRFQKELRIIRDVHELLRKRIKELREREKIGRSRPSEVETAITKIRGLEGELAGTKGSYASAKYLLEFLIGMSIEGRKLEDKESDDLSSQTLTEYLKFVETRPDVRAAEQAIKVAKSGIVVAQSGFWPTMNLTYSQYTHRENFLANVNWDLLLTMNVPLFSGTETIGQVKDSWGLFKQKKLSLSHIRRQAEMEIKQSYQGWRFSREQYRALKEAVASAEKNYKLQSDEYRRSLVNNLDVIAALESLHNTQQNENRAFYQMKQDEARLKVAIGVVA